MTTIPLLSTEPQLLIFALSDGGDPVPTQTYLTGPALDPAPLRAALGGDVAPDHVEVFPIKDIAPMILRDYLRQAHDVAQAQLDADAARLDALSGRVAIVAPAAVRTLDALEPQPHLTLIGRYDMPRPDDTPQAMPKARREAAPTPPPVAVDRPSGSRRIVYIIAAALLLAGGVVLLF